MLEGGLIRNTCVRPDERAQLQLLRSTMAHGRQFNEKA
jgi:hypothetical protein